MLELDDEALYKAYKLAPIKAADVLSIAEDTARSLSSDEFDVVWGRCFKCALDSHGSGVVAFNHNDALILLGHLSNLDTEDEDK